MGINNDNFIMLPTVDFCFKELMKNPKVRKGFVGAILGKDPKMHSCEYTGFCSFPAGSDVLQEDSIL